MLQIDVEAVKKVVAKFRKSEAACVRKDKDIAFLKDKIEKAKGIVEVGKKITALQDERDSLREQVNTNLRLHGEAMKKAETEFSKEIDLLKGKLLEQEKLLLDKDKVAHEAATVVMRTELDAALTELEDISTGLLAIDLDGKGSRVDQLEAVHKHLAGFTSATADVTKKLSSWGGFGPGYGNTIGFVRRAPEQIDEAKASCVRGGAQMAVALVASHNPEINVQRATKGFPELDVEGNPFDYNAVWKSVARYACKTARLVDVNRAYPVVEVPEKPEDESSSEDEEGNSKGTVSDE